MSDAVPVPTVLVMHQDDALRAEVRALLHLMMKVDPGRAYDEKKDKEHVREMWKRLNRLAEMTRRT